MWALCSEDNNYKRSPLDYSEGDLCVLAADLLLAVCAVQAASILPHPEKRSAMCGFMGSGKFQFIELLQ